MDKRSSKTVTGHLQSDPVLTSSHTPSTGQLCVLVPPTHSKL
ncbi:MAG: hypothetical protein V3581_01255 [Candidatus Cardinium sp.]|nr:hypothetical protein [Candidatus Cardinium sp.]